MSKPNRYRTDKDDDRETEPSRKGAPRAGPLILVLLAEWWSGFGWPEIQRLGKNSPTVWQA